MCSLSFHSLLKIPCVLFQVDMIQVEKKLTGKKINNHQTLPRPYAHATTHPPSPLPKKKNRFDKDPRAHSISKVAMRSNTSPLSERGVSAVRLLASARRHAERSYSCDDITPSPNHFAGSQRRYAGSTAASISKKEKKKKKQRARHREVSHSGVSSPFSISFLLFFCFCAPDTG